MRSRFSPLVQLTLFKVRELLREPEALFWVFVFPLLLALALGIAFREPGEPEAVRVGIEESPDAAQLAAALDAAPDVDARILPAAEAQRQLAAGHVHLVVLPTGSPETGWTYWYDPVRPESRLARMAVDDALQRAAGRTDPVEVGDRELTEKGSRYIDFLIPGLLGLNLLSTGIWGVGYYVVNARTKKLLKRLTATPMRRSHFLASQITGRLVFLAPEAIVLLGVAVFAFGVPVRGSIWTLALLILLGGLSFCGLGLLIASRTRTIEGVSGLMNLVLLPMWVLSGIFFSTERFPDAVQPVIQALPLTAEIDALRAVMLEGATLGEVAHEAAIVLAWGVVTFLLALKLFRWR